MAVASGLLILAGNGLAQDPLPPAPTLPSPPKWEGFITLGFTMTSGNSDSTLFVANAQTQKKWEHDELVFGADGGYGENDSKKSASYAHGFGQYNHLFTERFYGMFRVDALHDDVSDISYRITLSPGVGYYFIKKETTTLAGETGPGVVFERQGGVNDTYMTLRIAERFEHKFKNKARIWQSVEFLPQVDRFSNYLINAEVGVEAPLTEKLSVSIVLQDNYDNEPADGRKNNDIKLISGIKYKF